jgi:hypothetical protein
VRFPAIQKPRATTHPETGTLKRGRCSLASGVSLSLIYSHFYRTNSSVGRDQKKDPRGIGFSANVGADVPNIPSSRHNCSHHTILHPIWAWFRIFHRHAITTG